MSTDLFGRVSLADDGERNAFDFYPTPAFMTRSLLHHHPGIAGSIVLEPCAGGGAIADVLRREFRCGVSEWDLDPRHGQPIGDATSPAFWRSILCDFVVTNPPFNVALPILQHALEHASVGVAFLLRKTFLEPTEDRGPWLMAHPPTRIIGMPRYSFRGTGSDSVSCDWMIWEKQRTVGLPAIVIDHVAERRVR